MSLCVIFQNRRVIHKKMTYTEWNGKAEVNSLALREIYIEKIFIVYYFVNAGQHWEAP